MVNRSVEISMFYGATPNIMEKAAQLRKQMTPTEIIVWEFLRKKKVIGLKFRRQHPISKFIADFYGHRKKLVIEIDGGYHKRRDQFEYDQGRTEEFNEFGIKVIRFTNEEIEKNFSDIKQQIIKVCVERKKEIITNH